MILKPTYDEVVASLPADVRANLGNLMDFFRGMGLSPRWYVNGAMNIKYKGRILLRFTVVGGRVDLFATVARPECLDAVLEAQPEDVKQFYFNNLRACTGCNPKHSGGRAITILGRSLHVCAEPEIRLSNPGPQEVQMIKYLATVRRADIDNMPGAKASCIS